jgi:hypothetical protein
MLRTRQIELSGPTNLRAQRKHARLSQAYLYTSI